MVNFLFVYIKIYIMEYELEGIIIKKQNINDFDQIVTVVSNRGKFSFFAPSVKKENSKNGLNLNTLSLVNFEIIESQKGANLLPRLKRANTIISFPMNVMLKQEYIDLEFFLNKINSIKWQNFIDAYKESIKFLDSKKNIVMAYLLYKLLEIEGINPNIEFGCIDCQNKNNLVDFKFHQGGYLCINHAKEKIEFSILQSLYWINKAFVTFSDNTNSYDAQIIRKMIIQYLNEVI